MTLLYDDAHHHYPLSHCSLLLVSATHMRMYVIYTVLNFLHHRDRLVRNTDKNDGRINYMFSRPSAVQNSQNFGLRPNIFRGGLRPQIKVLHSFE